MPILSTASANRRRLLAVGFLTLALAGLITAGVLGPVPDAQAIGRDQTTCSFTVGYVPGSPIPCPTFTFQAAACTGEVPYSPGSPIPCPTIFPGNYSGIEGYVDAVNRGGVAGWARDLDFAGTVNVDIWVNGRYRATAPANQSRPDLIAVGIGARAFNIPLALNPGDQVTIYGLGVNSAGAELGTDPYLRLSSSPNVTTITVP